MAQLPLRRSSSSRSSCGLWLFFNLRNHLSTSLRERPFGRVGGTTSFLTLASWRSKRLHTSSSFEGSGLIGI